MALSMFFIVFKHYGGIFVKSILDESCLIYGAWWTLFADCKVSKTAVYTYWIIYGAFSSAIKKTVGRNIRPI